MKQNYTVNMDMNYCIKNSLSTYPLLFRYYIKQGLATNLLWPALKSKQSMCVERCDTITVESYLICNKFLTLL